MKKRNTYLNCITLEDALSMSLTESKKLNIGNEEVLHTIDNNIIDKVLSKSIYSKNSQPFYNQSAMDGIAVIVENIDDVYEDNPQVLEINKDYVYVDTGDHIYNPYNAVIMIEDIVELDDNRVKINSKPTMWQHVRNVGEDFAFKELLFTKGHIIRDIDIPLLIGAGYSDVHVYKPLSSNIIPTGDEIVSNHSDLMVNKILDTNSHMFSAMLKEYSDTTIHGVVKDDLETLKTTVLASTKEHDITVIGAGSSAGRDDYSYTAIKELGRVLFHGVAIKPGKPVCIGIVNKKLVICIPGYPVSAYFVIKKLLIPLIKSITHRPSDLTNTIKATLTSTIYSSLQYEEFVRVKLGKINNKIVATPLKRGAGILSSISQADGILTIPKSLEGYNSSSIVDVELLNNSNLNNSLVAIGSHDVTVDIIKEQLQLNNITLSSTHLGSMGGIFSLLKEECHIAPIHLLDEQTGEYNVSFINKYFKDKEMVLIKGIKRKQGLIHKKDTKFSINTIKDIASNDLLFINRQRGSGTRILLDYLLSTESIDKEAIKGYNIEMNTHSMLANSIANGYGDVALSIQSVANAYDLEFKFIANEDYDFLIYKDSLQLDIIKSFIKVLKSETFKNKVLEYGGYEVDNIGELVYI